MWVALQNGSLESLLSEAEQMEKRYEWLQAAKDYEKAADLALKNNELLKAAAFTKRVGFCYHRAAYQAQTNIEFKERLKLAIEAYEKEIKILKESKKEDKQVRVKQAWALIAYTKSCLETVVFKKKKLLDEWWCLENQVLKWYESHGDTHSAGLVCTDMIEFSLHDRSYLCNHSEKVIMEKEILNLADRAIGFLSKTGLDYELARVYCFVSLWYTDRLDYSPDFQNKRGQLCQIGIEYSKKALDLSSKTGDAWLIGLAYYSSMVAAVCHDFNYKLAIDYGKESKKYGNITRDKLLLSHVTGLMAPYSLLLAEFIEDPDKQRVSVEKGGKLARECIKISEIINFMPNVCIGYSQEIIAMLGRAGMETDPKNKQAILMNAAEMAREGIEVAKEWKRLSGLLHMCLSDSLRLLSITKSEVDKRKAMLLQSDSLGEKAIAIYETYRPNASGLLSLANYHLGLVQIELAKIETKKSGKIALLEKAVGILEKSNELLGRLSQSPETLYASQLLGKHSDRLGRVLQQIYYLTNEERQRFRAIEVHRTAAEAFMKGELPAHAAESHWYIAQLHGQVGEHQKASQNYESASQTYDLAIKKTPQLKEFYKDHSLYMQAWSQIEQARYNHSIEEYDKSLLQYKKAAKLHESTSQWNYLAPNYSAWASLEGAEGLSRKENTQQAKVTFQKALEQFAEAEKTMKEKIGKITSAEQKEMAQKLLRASNLRSKYCQARILVEDAKLLDREGKYRQSSKSYREATQNILAIVEKMDVEAERKELQLLSILCRAWEKMADAEATTSAEAYLESATFFESARELCFTRKASLWALGNSNFCRGLAAGVEYQTRLDLAEHAKAKRYMKNAGTNYLQAGFKNASEYAKATQRLFDAYIFMNQAESELNQEKRAKQYQMAENLLQVAAGSFVKAKQPEKTAQVQQMLETVREEKALAVSLNEVLHAPTVTSSTLSFTAPTPTSEASVGLETLEHANVQANLVVDLKEVRVGESLCLSVEFVNAGKEPALLTKVEDFVPPGFVVAKKPEIYRLEDACLNMKGKQIAPLKLVEAKLVLQPSKKGVYQLKPRVHFLDELGQNRVLQLKSVEIKVEEVILAGRVSTGTKELDSLLLGGIPEDYAVVLTGSPSDERELLIKNFLEAGIEKGGASFYVTTEADGLQGILERSGFYLFLCNLRPKVEVPDLPNVYRLHGKTDLNNLGIALVKAYRMLSKKPGLSRRVCVQILSDVLVNYGSKTARKWVSELITDLCSKGFTVLAVMDPEMHPADQSKAVLNLFDGEISLTQREDPLEGKSVVVRKLRNQDFIKNSICLTEQK